MLSSVACAALIGAASGNDEKLPGRPGPPAAVSIHVTVIDSTTLAGVPNARVRCLCEQAWQIELTNAAGQAEIRLFVPDNNSVRRGKIRCFAAKMGYRDGAIDVGHRHDGERIIRTIRLRQTV